MTASDKATLQKDIRRAFFRRVMMYAGIILVVVLALVFAFRQFKIYSNARLALREAKNVKLSLEMINTEYYGVGLSIYDDTAEGNIRKGVLSHVERLQGGLNGSIKLTGYDNSKRMITSFEFENEDYIVRYYRNGEAEIWQVCMIKEILLYD